MSGPIRSLVGITESYPYLRGLYIQNLNSEQPSENCPLLSGEVSGRSPSPIFSIGSLIFYWLDWLEQLATVALASMDYCATFLLGHVGTLDHSNEWFECSTLYTPSLSVQFIEIMCSFSFNKGQETLIQVKHVQGWASYYYNYSFNDECGYIF